jgi:hypothetical protein
MPLHPLFDIAPEQTAALDPSDLPYQKALTNRLGSPYKRHISQNYADLENKVPSGYGLRKASRGEHVTCGQYGIEVTRGQVLEGHRLWLITARVKNTGKGQLELEERTCSTRLGDGIAAVAACPRLLLAPAASAELYLAVRPRDPERERRDRPSLIDPGNAK